MWSVNSRLLYLGSVSTDKILDKTDHTLHSGIKRRMNYTRALSSPGKATGKAAFFISFKKQCRSTLGMG